MRFGLSPAILTARFFVGRIEDMEDEDPDGCPRYEFNWFAPWQWERIVLFRVSIALGALILFLTMSLCSGFIFLADR